jgi:hypothetical protein
MGIPRLPGGGEVVQLFLLKPKNLLITDPGRLPEGITVQNLLVHVFKPRRHAKIRKEMRIINILIKSFWKSIQHETFFKKGF